MGIGRRAGPLTSACGACGAEASPTAKFCRRCGAPIEVPPAPKLQAGDAVEPRACAACKGQLVPGARFCHQCGSAVSTDADAQTVGFIRDQSSTSALDAAPELERSTPAANSGLGVGEAETIVSGESAPAPEAIVKAPEPRPAAERVCASCQRPASTGNYCRSCGAALGPTIQAAPVAESNVELCPGCDGTVKPSAAFCRHCGLRLSFPDGTATRASDHPHVATPCAVCGAPDPGPGGLCAQCSQAVAPWP